MIRFTRIASFVFVVSAPLVAHGQIVSTYPDGNGGYTTITPGQPPIFTTPNAYGGYTTITPGQVPVFSFPNANGGYTTVNPVQPPPNMFDTNHTFGR